MEWAKWVYSLMSIKGWTITAYIVSVLLCSILHSNPFLLGLVFFGIINAGVFLALVAVIGLSTTFGPIVFHHLKEWWNKRPQRKV